jgi:hypothetical protein
MHRDTETEKGVLMSYRVIAACFALGLFACTEEGTNNSGNQAGTGVAGSMNAFAGTNPTAGTTSPMGGMMAGTGQVGGMGGTGGIGASGTGASGTGVSGTGASGTGVSGTGASGTGVSGTGVSGTGGTSAGTGGTSAGTTGGTAAGTGGTAAGTGAGTGAAGTGGMGNGCTPAPSGTFSTERVTSTGPDGNYTIIRPTTLGEGGFKHPPIAWGNGLSTRPSQYDWLDDIAAHGFVIIANPGTGSNPTVVRQGLEWLMEQNDSGEYAGMLAPDCAGTIGYSMGGGAAVGSGDHPAVKAIVSIHGLPDAAEDASGPILLTTSEADTFVDKSGFVEPCYERSSVQPTILASHATGSHTEPMRSDGGDDLEPAIAWLRYWIYGDESQAEWFFGDDCTLCSWPDFRRKNHPDWD